MKTFYLGAIGQLILNKNIINAKAIIKSIFIIVLSETDGNLKNGCPTQCEQERVKLINLITTGNIELETHEIKSNDSVVSEIEEKESEAHDYIKNPFENSWAT